MFRIDNDDRLPSSLWGPVLLDKLGLPRYWSNIWSILNLNALHASTRTNNLRHIEALYSFTDDLKGPGFLDDIIAKVQINEIFALLEAFFVSIRNQPVSNNSEKKWRTALYFLRNTLLLISKTDANYEKFVEGERKFHYLETLYDQLHVKKKSRTSKVRSLPANVVEALFEITDPSSSQNPFRNEKIKWQVYIIFTILLKQGLRRGELLLLPVDTVKSAFDKKSGETRYWLNVTENKYETFDKRYSEPGIKTINAYRQIPVSKIVALAIQTYVENYRGRTNHSFLINSQLNLPMSNENITKIFSKLSRCLPKTVIKELKDRTGKESITPHDLRHTSAVFFLSKLLEMGDEMDEATQKMRVFFGWAPGSSMPLRYAKAVFQDRLSKVWNKIFDNQVDILRSIPKDFSDDDHK